MWVKGLHRVICIYPPSFCNKVRAEFSCLTALEEGSPRSKCQWGHALSEVQGRLFPHLVYLFSHSVLSDSVTPCQSVQSLSRVRVFAIPWTAAHQSFLSITISWSLLKLMSIKSVIPSHSLPSPSPPAFNLFQHQEEGLFLPFPRPLPLVVAGHAGCSFAAVTLSSLPPCHCCMVFFPHYLCLHMDIFL